MTNAYVYQADLYCEDCATEIRESLRSKDVADTQDSNDYPQGPYPDGGGESDAPAHCGQCGAFLENPLTDEGKAYVNDAFIDYMTDCAGNADTLNEWADFYGVRLFCAGAGLHGYLYQDGPNFFTDEESAVQYLVEAYELTEDQEADLRETGYVALDPDVHGNEYAEIQEKSDPL
jgi:hypothetical protein